MAATTRPKPWEMKGSASTSNNGFRVSSAVANGRNAPDVPDVGNVGTPSSPNAAIHIGGRSSSSATNSSLSPSTSPSVPPRPSTLSNSSSYNSPYGNSMYNNSSSYGSGAYGSSYGGYGNRYGSSYGSSGYGGYGSSYGGYGSSGYGSSYGGYGSSYGGYGSRYGSSYGGYGGYGSSYGSGYGNGAYGQMGAAHQDGAFGTVMQNGYNQINRFGQMVDAFTRFSRLLDANFDAMHGSFASIIRLMEVFGEFAYVVRTFAIFRVLTMPLEKIWKLLNTLLGRQSTPAISHQHHHQRQHNNHLSAEGFDIKEFNNQNAGKKPARRSFTFFLVMVISCLSAPAILMKLWEIWRRRHLLMQKEHSLEGVWENDSPQQQQPMMNGDGANATAGGFKVRALYDFRGESPQDLSFRKDETFTVIDRSFPDWWEGQTIDGRRGFFPQNFVQAID